VQSKVPFGQKKNAIFMIFFTQEKGHFVPGKRALGKTWGGLAPNGLPVPTPLGLERDTSQSEVYRVLRCSCQQIN
jgi:hypothetical protein